jgi:hypothetical protein
MSITGQEKLKAALRQIYSGAMAIEKGAEPIVEGAQNIQRICDAALRDQPLPEIYQPVKSP